MSTFAIVIFLSTVGVLALLTLMDSVDAERMFSRRDKS